MTPESLHLTFYFLTLWFFLFFFFFQQFDHSELPSTARWLFSQSQWLFLCATCIECDECGSRSVPLLCSWVGLMRYQSQTSIHQPHWWGQWGATALVKRGIVASGVGIGQPCLQRLVRAEGLKQNTSTAASTSLSSAGLNSLALRGSSSGLWFFRTKTPEEKCTTAGICTS